MRGLLMLFCLVTRLVWAQDPPLVIDSYTQHFVVEPSGAYTLTIDQVKHLRHKSTLDEHGQYTISYQHSLETVDDIRALTRKPDGRELAVQAAAIHEQQEPGSSEAPTFQDRRRKVIVFSEVEVGDRLVVHYVIRRHTPLFPGQFEDLSASAPVPNPQFRLIYDMPASLPLQADAIGFVAQPIDQLPGRLRYQWQYQGETPERQEADAVSLLDRGPRLAVSTFASYAAFARAYEQGAQAQAQPDAALRALAAQIIGPLTDPHAQVRALSDWVRQNIRYVATYVGNGSIVPHPARSVLDHRYGDCKDHAALLQALLVARGIDSSSALINLGNAFRLPSVPTLGILNHVIVYVPELDLYLDPTAASIAAGYLPVSVLDKPVLLTRSGQLARTPPYQQERNQSKASLHLLANGDASFTLERSTQGAAAETFRQVLASAAPGQRDWLVSHLLQSQGQRGGGRIETARLAPGGHQFEMKIAGRSEGLLRRPGPSVLSSSFSLWGNLAESIDSLAQEPQRTQDFVCPPLDSSETLRIRLPAGRRFLALPPSLRLYDKEWDYRASYRRRGQTLEITRSARFQHPGLICTPADYRRMSVVLASMLRDLRSPILVQ